jgi:DNA-binding response OmpR family regulator
MKLLVVEDEPKTGEYIQRGLTEAGSLSIWQRMAWTATMAMTEPYDLVILDVMLPDVDGWRIVQSLRDAQKTVPVLFLTARDMSPTGSRGWKWAQTTISSNHLPFLSCWPGCAPCCAEVATWCCKIV